jgi:CelD/BcsL family acetyltransferase involved in cellulose biosynthesis
MPTTLRTSELDALDGNSLAAWDALARQLPGAANPFATPQFILPAARWLTPEHCPLVVLIERTGAGGRELIGLGCFTRERPSWRVPVPHLRSYQTLHTFRSGMLCAPGESAPVARALLDHVGRRNPRAHAIEFHNLPASCPIFSALREGANGTGGDWFERHRFERPVLDLGAGISPLAGFPGSTLKDLRRCRRRLAERGEVCFRIRNGGDAVNEHLRLEHAGWKGGNGTSLLSSEAQAGFFRELSARFEEAGAIVFAETLCDGKVIASSSNLLLGDTLSAFKIGWDPDFARSSPGRLNEMALLEQTPVRWPQLQRFDSLSREKSYLADLLPHRETMVSGALATSRLGQQAMSVVHPLRQLAFRIRPPTPYAVALCASELASGTAPVCCAVA